MQNGRTSPKNKKEAFSSQPSAFSQTNTETAHNRVRLEIDPKRRSAEEDFAEVHAKLG
jgi:hypothetical protein